MSDDKARQIRFSDGSLFTVPDAWFSALREKWREQHDDKTWDGFLEYILVHVEDQFRRKVVLTKFGEQPWDNDHDPLDESYRTMADLAEDSIYGFARFYILRAILAEHNVRVLTPRQALEEIEGRKFRGD